MHHDEQATRTRLRAVPLPMHLKLAYSLGAAPDLMVNTAINVFLLFYATTVCGLSAALAGTALALGLIVDAVLDPLIGSRSDNWHSQWGRRLPFMLAGAPLLAVSFVMLFSLPELDSQLSLFAVLAFLCVLARVSLSIFLLPYLAVGAEVSDDDRERSQIIAWRWAAGMVAAMAAAVIGFSGFFNGPGGIANRAAYQPFAIALSTIIFAAACCATFAVFRTLPRQHLPPARQSSPGSQFANELRELVRNPTFRVIFAVLLLFSAAQGVTQSLGLHAVTYFWRLSGDQVQLPTLGFALGLILGAPLTVPLVSRFERRTLAFAGLSGLMLTQAGPPLLKLCGALLLQGDALAQALAAMNLFGGMMTSMAAIALLSMVTEAVDEHEYLFGARREGLYFASWIFASKAASGLGTFLSGLALSWIGFPVEQTRRGGVDVVLPEQVANALGFIYGPGAAILSVMAVLTLLRYRLDRRTHASMMTSLQVRRATAYIESAN
jgi:GPH family glycoside/pentoside/hexuronide:cation symporter